MFLLNVFSFSKKPKDDIKNVQDTEKSAKISKKRNKDDLKDFDDKFKVLKFEDSNEQNTTEIKKDNVLLSESLKNIECNLPHNIHNIKKIRKSINILPLQEVIKVPTAAPFNDTPMFNELAQYVKDKYNHDFKQ